MEIAELPPFLGRPFKWLIQNSEARPKMGDQEEHSVHQGRSSMVESGILGIFVAVRDKVFRQYASVAFHRPWMCGNGLQIRISRRGRG
jgi:hypothetical protein